MSSNSRWASSNPSSSHPHPPRPPAKSGADESFLWLSTSFNTEGGPSNLLGATEEFPRELSGNISAGGEASLRTTIGGKPSRTGHHKMANNTSQSNPAAIGEPSIPPIIASKSDNLSKNSLDVSAFRSSWTSTSSDGSGASITQSDFDFLTPSFIAIDDGSGNGMAQAPSQGRRGGKKGLGVPESQRITLDSSTLGRLHDRDRESSVLPPASVRSGSVGHYEPFNTVVKKVLTSEDTTRRHPSTSGLLLSPTSTQPLKIPNKLPQRPHQETEARNVPAGGRAPLPSQRQQPLPGPDRYYHQPPLQGQPAQELRHNHSASSRDTTASSATNPSSRLPLSIPKSGYPPTAFSNPKVQPSLSKEGSYSAASGAGYVASASGSPATTVSTSLGGAGVHSPPTSLTALITGRNHGDDAGEGVPSKHPYASSSAYRMAVTDFDDETQENEQRTSRDQHPFAQYRPQEIELPSSYEQATFGAKALDAKPSQSGALSQPSKTSPKLLSKMPSTGTSGVSESHRDSGRRSDHEKQDWNSGSPARQDVSKTSKKEKRQSAATLLSLRIRNVYPAPSRFNSSRAPPNTPPHSKSNPNDGLPDLADENIDMWILKWCGVILGFLFLLGIMPILGTAYTVAGHAILRAKARTDVTNLAASLSDPASESASSSFYLETPLSSSAKAGAAGGAILAVPVLLLIFIAVGPTSLTDYKNAVQTALFPASPADDIHQTPEKTPAERRRSRRASSLWGPNTATASFREQTTAELALNVCVNVFLAFLFLCLGAGCASLGVTVLSSSQAVASGQEAAAFLTVSTAALAGLVGGAVVFGGMIIVGAILGWVVYEGGKPNPLPNEQQPAIGSGFQGVTRVNANGGGVGAGNFSEAQAVGSSSGGGQQAAATSIGREGWI